MSISESTVITILFLGGSRRVSLAELFRSGGERMGVKVRFVSYELDTDVPIALMGKVIKGLRFDDPKVVDDIMRVVKEHDVKIILPIVNDAMAVAARLKEQLAGVFVPVPDYKVTSMMYDKLAAAEAFSKAGIPIPRTYSIIDNEMPAIAKPRMGGSSRGVHIFHEVDDLMNLANLNSYLLQEYIENAREFTVDCYVSAKGEILTAVPRERLEVMGGEVTRTVTQRIPCIIDMSHEVIRKFGFTGPVTIQYLYDSARDRYLLMEVNPRLGGGVICSIYAGAPITDYILREAMGLSVSPCADWTDNVLMARYQKEAIFYER